MRIFGDCDLYFVRNLETAGLTYILNTIHQFAGYKFQVRLDDEEEWYEASSVIVGKSRYYAGRYSLFNGASLCVPQLHVAIFTGDTRADFMRYAAVIAMEDRKSVV